MVPQSKWSRGGLVVLFVLACFPRVDSDSFYHPYFRSSAVFRDSCGQISLPGREGREILIIGCEVLKVCQVWTVCYYS